MTLKRKHANRGHEFGTAPVFLAAISTILGAILFLRFGYAVAHTGLAGAIAIILIGHAITIPTALAIAEIATNLKVEGGGEYFIISRSFGRTVGSTIGISLYFSQAISVAFYMIAFAEAFRPAFPWIQSQLHVTPRLWMICVPATLILLAIILKKGADIGVTLLWVVVITLGISLLSFLLGKTATAQPLDFFTRIGDPHSFFLVFAIVFPAFTGMTAGVGLAGDLKNPRKSIPLGTLAATFTGMLVYFFVVFKLSLSLTPAELAADQFAMSRVALWGPLIPIGLAAATISSAIGSILIAPRTLQALASDDVFPLPAMNRFLKSGRGKVNEPVHATLITSVIVVVFVSLGSVDFVAQIISMFFMITYGSLCLVSFLEHFAGNPSYRPTFRSRWYFSLIGAAACFIMMFQMAPLYALGALLAITVLYFGLKKSMAGEDDLSAMIKGVLFQLTRRLQVSIQKRRPQVTLTNWRPSLIAVSGASMSRIAPFDLLRWISEYYGFGTYIHFIKGALDEDTKKEAHKRLGQMIDQATMSHADIYIDTIVSPSFKTAVAQIVQIPGIAGMENNTILFEFPESDPSAVDELIGGCHFAAVVDFNITVLRSSERHFGMRNRIDIWLTPGDYRNANLMILLAYIMKGHRDWSGCDITLFAAFDEKDLDRQVAHLNRLIDIGRIPISRKNVQRIPWKKDVDSFEKLVNDHSQGADLVMMGFSLGKLTQQKGEFFTLFGDVKDILFVRAGQSIVITAAETPDPAAISD